MFHHQRLASLPAGVALRPYQEDAIERAMGSGFLTGQNDRGWVMDLEFFLRPDTVTKILEGKYDDREGFHETSEQKRERANAGVFDRLQAAAEPLGLVAHDHRQAEHGGGPHPGVRLGA